MEALAVAIEQLDAIAADSMQRETAPCCALCHQPIAGRRQLRLEETS
jgi:hypothetical protein